MDSVLCLSLLLGCVSAALCLPAASPRGRLLRVPKVYNALITSDEPLLPSRTEQATVGQVLYYPPHQAVHHTYPASSGPLILPQVAAQAPPLYHPSQQQFQYQPQQVVGEQQVQQVQQLVSLPPQDPQHQQDARPLEVYLQPQPQAGQLPQDDGLTNHYAPQEHQPGPEQQASPSPVVYASDVQQQYVSPPPDGASHRSEQVDQQQPSASFPAARAAQTVEHVAELGAYQPPPAVHIDSIKNNRPTLEGIRDVPPPPLPVGRGKSRQRPAEQPIPPGILPF